MKFTSKYWSFVTVCALLLNGCGGAYHSGSVGPSVGFGFYHSTFGHGWGDGYYRGYDAGAADAAEAKDTMDAIDSMGMPDMEMGPDVDFDF